MAAVAHPVRIRFALSLWLLGLVLCAVVLALRLSLSYDLGLFLPTPVTTAQQVLIERLGQGPGSRLLIVGLPDAGPEKVATVSQALRGSEVFAQVLDGLSLGTERIPEPLWRYRYLLTDPSLDSVTLGAALRERLADLGLFGGDAFNALVRADPTLAALRVAEALAAGIASSQAEWALGDMPLLLVETHAGAFDLDAQRLAIDAIRRALRSVPELDVTMATISGAGAFGVLLRNTIHGEAQWRSIGASLAILLVLWVAFRRWSLLFVAALPLASGLAAGIATVALLFGQVHGITLAFGFTLLGVAIDYPLHFFSHARVLSRAAAIQRIWPTLRLGLASTLLAYVAIALSGSQGTAQLGVFTAAGLLAAGAVTRWLLPALPLSEAPIVEETVLEDKPKLAMRAIIVAGALGAALLWWRLADGLWENDLAALSPVPADVLKRDAQLRQALGTPEMRYAIALHDTDLQRLLLDVESLDGKLPQATGQGLLSAWQLVTTLLPSDTTQRRRAAQLPTTEVLRQTLTVASKGTSFAADAFDPFVNAVAASAELSLLQLTDYADTPYLGFLDNHLYRSGEQWVALVSLFDLADADALRAWLAMHSPQAELVDFKLASENLVASYRQRTMAVLGIALVLILALLLWRLSLWRALWCVACVAASIILCGGLLVTIFGPLNLYHFMALLLVAGLGLDYALFLSQPSGSMENRANRHAVLACVASTSAAFAVLATSAIPALQSLGMAVALGALISYGVARLSLKRAALP